MIGCINADEFGNRSLPLNHGAALHSDRNVKVLRMLVVEVIAVVGFAAAVVVVVADEVAVLKMSYEYDFDEQNKYFVWWQKSRDANGLLLYSRSKLFCFLFKLYVIYNLMGI